MPGPNKSQVIALYRSFLRHADKIPNYNFKSHAVRRTRMGFVKNRNVEGQELLAQYQNGLKQLEIVKRQAIINQLFPDEGSVMQKM
jgi:hypothetical protein